MMFPVVGVKDIKPKVDADATVAGYGLERSLGITSDLEFEAIWL